MVLVINYINQFNRILRMKIVLKFNDAIKLYTSNLDFEEIVNYVRKEFDIKSSSLELSFFDEDNDQITVLSNEDLQVMQAVFEGKGYVKMNVKGEINNINVPQVEDKNDVVVIQEVKQVQVTKVQKPAEVEVEIEQPSHPKEEEIIEPVVMEQPIVEQKKNEQVPRQQVVNQEKNKEWDCKEWKKRKFQKMEAYLNQTVAKLVDQRIKALLPCLKEQILNQAPVKAQPKGIVHEGFQCKSCLQKPIVGIRYECPKCPFFSLCQECQSKIDHEHNLLKIKKILPKQQEEKVDAHCFKKWFGHGHHGHGHHGHRHGHHGHGRSSSKSQQKCKGRGPHWFIKKCQGLSTMFGGKPQDYKQFVNENEGLKPRETYKKYADLNKICDDDFRQKFIDMRSQKLSNKFGKPADQYKSFVEANYELRFGQMMHLLEEKGERHIKKCWGGKRYNFNESESPQKKECPIKEEKAEEKIEQVQEIKKEEIKSKVQEPMLISECRPIIEEKKESSEIIRQKGAILLQMQDIFGADNTKAYYRFIDEHFSKGMQELIQLWIENESKIGKCK